MRFVTKLAMLLAIAAPSAFAQWSSNPNANNPICTEQYLQRLVRIISDGKGGAIMTWEDGRPQQNIYDIYAQRIDANGSIKWPLNGAPVCTIVGTQNKPQIAPDGKGGAWIVWKDVRTGDNDIMGQHLDSTGAMLHSSEGIDLVPAGLKAREQSDPVICVDGKGGIFVAFMDNIQGGNFDNQIMVTLVDSNGVEPWSGAGYLSPITRNSGMYQYSPAICTDQAGGAIVAWMWFLGGASGYYDLFIQRVTNTGRLLWGKIGYGLCTATGNQGIPVIDSDGLKGAVCAWGDYRSKDVQVYTQRVDSGGTSKWPGGPVSTLPGTTDYPAIIGMGNGSAVVVWEDGRGANLDIYAQYYDANGVAKWTPNGVPVCTATNRQYMPYVTPDGSGGVIIVWEDRRNGNLNSDIFAQRLDASGNALWAANGILVCGATNIQSAPVALADGNGGGIFAWEDYRANLTNANVYAFKVQADGTYPKSKPAMSMSSSTVDFGILGVGAKRDKPVLLTNIGGDTLHITNITSSIPEFKPRPTSAVLASGTAFNDTIRFTPTAAGPINGYIVITSDAISSPDTLRVKGTGTGMPVFEVAARKYFLGYVKVGLKKDSSIIISNAGLDTMKITAVTASNAAITITPGIVNIPPGKSVTQTVSFGPKVAGTVNARIQFTSNAMSTRDTLFISGTGTLDVSIAVTPQTIDFGKIPVGSRMDTIVTINNNGGDTLRVADISSTNSDFFTVPTSFKIAPLSSYKLLVRCVASKLGVVSGQLSITSNSNTAPDKINVTATGAADVLFAPVSLSFGKVDVGAYRDTVVMIENKKLDTLRITAVTSDNPRFTAFPATLLVPPGFTLADTLRFAPTVTGVASGTITFTSNSSTTPDKITVTGEGKTSTDVEQPDARISGFTLGASYPNPVKTLTQIPFVVHRASRVSLRIENMLGQTLETLVEDTRGPGAYKVQWDASAFPAGAYRYVLEANGVHAAARVLVIR